MLLYKKLLLMTFRMTLVFGYWTENNAITCAATWLRGRKLTRISLAMLTFTYSAIACASHVKLS